MARGARVMQCKIHSSTDHTARVSNATSSSSLERDARAREKKKSADRRETARGARLGPEGCERRTTRTKLARERTTRLKR